ncbi:antitermination protein NusG [Candidatus Reidiella endopervernicosa]|nr:antitermination protein NusG [Candidatus Reidiella endopervernicosa]QKQ27917.1 antitermination protein NusG [Candidatus Reidiella endopervernicosa]
MLIKILFTVLVVIVVLLFVKSRSSGRVAPRAEPVTVEKAPPSDLRIAAYIFIGLMMSVTVGILLLEWYNGSREVVIRVIDTRSGDYVDYQARRDDVARGSFTTVDGRKVYIADVERIELIDE